MKISCQYCGRIHDKKFDCGKKPQKINKRTHKDRFRSSTQWTRKAIEIKERDNYLCQVCLSKGKLNCTELETHHIIPLEEDYERRLDNDNLITLCHRHHEQAENGNIDRDTLLDMVKGKDIPPML